MGEIETLILGDMVGPADFQINQPASGPKKWKLV
jgi:hypothetical protein